MSEWYAEDIDVVIDGARLAQKFPENLPLEKWGETYDRLRANAAILAASKDLYNACKAGAKHLEGPELLRIAATIMESHGVVSSRLVVMLRAKADAEEKAIRLAEGCCNIDQGKMCIPVIRIQCPGPKSA
jgi:hypothetical protein